MPSTSSATASATPSIPETSHECRRYAAPDIVTRFGIVAFGRLMDAGTGIRFVDRGVRALANYPGDWYLLVAEAESVR